VPNGAKPEKTLISGMVPGIIVKKIPIPPTFILIKFYYLIKFIYYLLKGCTSAFPLPHSMF